MRLLKKIFNNNASGKPRNNNNERPKMEKSTTYGIGDIGKIEWIKKDSLLLSDNKQTMEWNPSNPRIAFLPARTCLHLHSGRFILDFNIVEMNSAQIGVGFMLLWDNGLLDWGFFGYLGAGYYAWAYDPSTGDVVNAEKSIQGGLPKFENKRTGVVSIDLNLPRNAEGEAIFFVNGVKSDPIKLPVGAVIVPAATLLREKQKITLSNFKRY